MLYRNKTEKTCARLLGQLNYTNPFLAERMEMEQAILGAAHVPCGNNWSRRGMEENSRHNIVLLQQEAQRLTLSALPHLKTATPEELEIYFDVAVYHLFEKYRPRMTAPHSHADFPDSFLWYREFLGDWQQLLGPLPLSLTADYPPERLFAIFFQIHRAFFFIYEYILGSTDAAGALRAAIWQSIFTCDIRRYYRSLYNRMHNLTTLITGESGTGKELVAQAIAKSQYIPFHPEAMTFAADFREQFHPLHLSAMPKTILESELFGHKRGAYTGALTDRIGHLESCGVYGSVFLDEIGEIDGETQVKLLRVLQSRRFQRIGENRERPFEGKILAATNRDLGQAIAENTFRIDLYYRLCGDVIRTAPLSAMIGDDQSELENFIQLLASRLLGTEDAAEFSSYASEWIVRNLKHYHWPGNVRELEQCVRNLLVRGEYIPDSRALSSRSEEILLNAFEEARFSADELLSIYVKHACRRYGSLSETARKLDLDRRTVKKYLLSPLPDNF